MSYGDGLRRRHPIEFCFGTGTVFQSTAIPATSFTDHAFLIRPRLPGSVAQGNTSTEPDEDLSTDLVDMAKISGKTGEESDEILLSCQVQLFVFRPQTTIKDEEDEKVLPIHWSDLGACELHFNRSEGFHRLILRRGILRTPAINVRVVPQMKPILRDRPKNSIQFLSPYTFCETEGPKWYNFALKFKNGEDAGNLHKLWVDTICSVT
jgi:hypothetical protein